MRFAANELLGVWKLAPMAVHNLIDIVAGAVLAASPWLFGFADESANVWVPFVVVRPRGNLSRAHDEAAGRVQLPEERHANADDGEPVAVSERGGSSPAALDLSHAA